MRGGSGVEDNGQWVAKTKLRSEIVATLPPAARILEGFAGSGKMYRQVWSPFAGATIDKDEAKVLDAARERPNWACYRGDTERVLLAGWMSRVPFDVIDFDAWGSPWPFVLAWSRSKRERAPKTWLILTDGYMAKTSVAPLCRALFAEAGPRTHSEHRRVTNAAHVAVQAALVDGRIPNTEPCEVCQTPQRREGDAWFVIRHHFDYALPLETIPLCLEHHQQVHGGRIPEPRTGRIYSPTAERRDVPAEDYLDLARRRIGEWVAPGVVDSFETIRPERATVRLHLVGLRFQMTST